MAKDYPKITIPPPGPRARAVIERDQRVMSQNYKKDYPLVAERGQGRHGRGRGRQSLPRLRRRDRGGGHRPLPSRRGGGDPRPVREVPPHVRDRLLLRERGGARRRAGPPRPRSRPVARLLRELRGGGGGGGGQAGPPPYRPVEDRVVLRGLPWPHLRSHEPDREQAGAAPRLRSLPARGAAHALRVLLPLSREPEARDLRNASAWTS